MAATLIPIMLNFRSFCRALLAGALGSLGLLPALSPAASSAPVTSPRATVELLSATDSVAPGQTVELGLHFRFQPGWHIYWMNPGDAGQTPRIELFAPAASTVSDVHWPAPERHVDGPITTLVHQGDVLLPLALHAAGRTGCRCADREGELAGVQGHLHSGRRRAPARSSCR